MSKTVFVLNQFSMPKSHAGGTRHVELFGGLVDWNVRIFAGGRTNAGETVASGGLITAIPVTRYRGNGADRVLNWASYSAGAFARAVAARPGPDVVYGSSPHMGAALAGLMVSRLRRVPFVLEIRDMWPGILAEQGVLSETSSAYKALKRLERLLYRSADRIVILAEGNAPKIAADGGVAEHIHFIPNNGDPADFEPSAERSELRRRYGFDDFTVVYTGAHGPANGLDLALDAAAELEAESAGVTFAFFGGGIDKARLQEIAAQRGLGAVRFFDPVPKSEIPDVLAAADCGLHCLADVELFRTGVSPNKLYDYMAAGLPVITNNLGDMAAMVDAAGSGLAVEPTGIAAGVRELAACSGAELAAMGDAGRRFMDEHRSRRAMTRRLAEVLDDVTGR